MLPLRCLTALNVILLVLAWPAGAQKPSVVPGVSVGRVRLGMTRAQVRQAIGKPTRTGTRLPGVREETWSVKPPLEWQRELFLAVLYQSGRVIQIEFNAPRYITANDLSLAKTLAQFRHKYPKATRRDYAHIDPEGGGYRSLIYDAVDAGIAFSIGGQDTLTDDLHPDTIRIHRRGRPALPDENAKPSKP